MNRYFVFKACQAIPLGGIGGSNSLGEIVLRTVLKLFYFHFIGWKLKHLKPIWFIFLNATTVMSSSRTFLFISLFCYTTNHDLFDSTNTLRCLIKGGIRNVSEIRGREGYQVSEHITLSTLGWGGSFWPKQLVLGYQVFYLRTWKCRFFKNSLLIFYKNGHSFDNFCFLPYFGPNWCILNR